jgi:uncharacterized protein (TIGR03905 family)
MVMQYEPKGVCSKHMEVTVDDGVVRALTIKGGCHGNLQAIIRLVEGMPMEEVIARLEGIRCGFKKTSCPDQLAQALKTIQKNANNANTF